MVPQRDRGENDIPFADEHLSTSKRDRKRCQMIYLNLIKMLDGKESISSTHIIRELWETKRCDRIHDMSEVRARTKLYIEKLAPGSFRKVFAIGDIREESVQDIADSTVIHYNSWYRDNMINALSWRNKGYYYFFCKTDVALASWSIVGGGVYGGTILYYKYRPKIRAWLKSMKSLKFR
jgi:hypothetical protein